MKKALLAVVVLVALVIWVASWFRNPEAVKTSAAKPWPGGMGSLDSAGARLPKQNANEASVKLMALAKALPKSDAIEPFVGHEIARGELAIGKPPALPDVSAIRELLLHEPVVWQRVEGIGGDDETQARRKAVMETARALVASALAKARANDPAAWDDLHAAWLLARTLDGHPQMMMQTASLAIGRMVNAVAWKMPLPVPAWFAEVGQRDAIRPLVESFHFQTAEYATTGLRLFPTVMLAHPVDHDRKLAETVLNTTQCDVTIPMNEIGTDLAFVWRRAFRYRAEREATANALRVREGKPVEARSRCSDGAWTFDGTTLRFSRAIPTGPPDTPMPLALRITPLPGASPRSILGM